MAGICSFLAPVSIVVRELLSSAVDVFVQASRSGCHVVQASTATSSSQLCVSSYVVQHACQLIDFGVETLCVCYGCLRNTVPQGCAKQET